MSNAKKTASDDERDILYGRVLDDWHLILRDGKWLSKKSLIQTTSAELCDVFLKIAGNSARDLANSHELCWAAFDKYVLPKLRADDDYEERTHNGQLEVRCCQPAPRVDAPKSVDLEIAMQPPPTTASVAEPVAAGAEDGAGADAWADNVPAPLAARVSEDQAATAPQPMTSLPPVSSQPAAPVSVDETVPARAAPASQSTPLSTLVPLDQIQVGPRHRKDLGDIPGLAASIDRLGLLQLIPVTPDCRLIAGERRLAALQHLGRTEVPVVIAAHLDDALHLLQAERDENTCRKDFTPSEAVALGQALEALERLQAKQRQHAGRPRKTGGKLPPVSGKGKTRDKVAQAVGMSGRSYEKAKFVVEAANQNPERYGGLVDKMDTSGKVDAAYREVKHRASHSKQQASAAKAIESAASNGKVETLTVNQPTTAAATTALAATLLSFLGQDVCRALTRAWTANDQPAKPAASMPRLRSARSRRARQLQELFE